MIYTKNESGTYVWDYNQELLIPKDHKRMTDEEVTTHLNPPTPTVTMEMVNIAVQNLTDAQARTMGFKNMVDAYNWAIMYQDADAIRLQEWDKKCWDAVDALNGVAPLDLNAFLNTLPKF